MDGAKRDVSGARHTVSLLGSNLKKQEEEVERTRAIVDKYLSAVEDAGRRLADMRAAQKRSSMSEWNIALTIAVGDAQEAGREAGFNGTLMKEREWERDRTKARLEVQEKELAEAERKLAKVKAEQKERADELRAKWKESRRAT